MTRMPLWLAAGAACAAALPFVVVLPRPAAPPPGPVVERSPEAAVVAARSLAKIYLAQEVATGRRTAPEAAAVFGWLNGQPPASPTAAVQRRFGDLSADASEADVLCAQVTAFIVGTIRQADPYGEPEAARMAREQVDAARGPDGRPVLPAVNVADCEELLRRAAAAAKRCETAGPVDIDWIGEGLVLVGR